jgi:sensor domain CHASE-containing protein/two-component sensor histidine kinase
LKLHNKTLFILGLTFISLILIQYAASQLIFLDSFATLEEQDTSQNVERVRSALLVELDNLDTYTYDWAAWDDTYAFIQDVNEDYIESNLVDGTFIDLELNFMVFVDSSGGIVFSKAFDLENEEEIPLPESLLEHIFPNSVLLQHPDTDSKVTGILLLSEEPMLVASRPIITSNDEGPILGSLIMGYYLDSARLDSLAETTHLSLNMQRIDNLQMPTDFQEAISSLSEETPIFIKPITSDSIAGYTLFEDIYEKPCLVLKVDLPRNIYQQGKASISYFILLLLTTGITFSIVIMLLLEKTVLSRLAQLNVNVNHIRSKEDPSERISIEGKDEISNLASEINRMLTTLEHAQNKLQMLNEKLGFVGSLTRHDVRNKLAVISNNVYLAKERLIGDPSALEYLADIELAIENAKKIFDFATTYEQLGMEKLSKVDVEKSVKEASMMLDLDNVTLVNDCHGLVVRADSLLMQLFYNLIDNTLRHGKNVTQIRAYYEEKKDHLKLIYEDNGVGIPEEEKELIFNEGYGKGTGYGLYLIKKICENYGWVIKETGRPGKGAQFIMTIPKMNKNKKINYYVK